MTPHLQLSYEVWNKILRDHELKGKECDDCVKSIMFEIYQPVRRLCAMNERELIDVLKFVTVREDIPILCKMYS